MPRRRFQTGNIIIRGKTPKRYWMYREDVLQSDGTFKRVRRCVVLGLVSSLSERAITTQQLIHFQVRGSITPTPSAEVHQLAGV